MCNVLRSKDRIVSQSGNKIHWIRISNPAKYLLIRKRFLTPFMPAYEMICWYFTGMCDEEELLSHISRLQKQKD
ncbi:MAG: hypothetical protein CME32_18105 [Gimesia sp.]|nr:hypothetical protein [Gimesia sp.]